MMRVVIALGGNALLKRGQPMEAGLQRENVRQAAASVAGMASGHDVVITHGNGPQVGLLALQSAAYEHVDVYPLDVLGAESEGMIGYLIEQELKNLLPGRQIATLLTQTVVDPEDPAFQDPDKFVGPVYEEEEAERLRRQRNWTMKKDGGKYRRVVPSPAPRRIMELPAIRLLVENGVLVVCAGGGGIPVAIGEGGDIRGLEAVVDKDRASALLASELRADALLLLTDVDAVYRDWGGKQARPIRRASPDEIRPEDFAAGSMGPKVEAACRFAREGGGMAGIGALQDASAILEGEKGTIIRG